MYVLMCVCLCLRDACTEISVSSIARCRYLVEAIKLSEMGIMCLLCVCGTQENYFYQNVAMATIPRITMCHVSPDFNGQWFCAVHGDYVLSLIHI